MIVPYPAGGGVDAMGRIVGQKLSAALGQQVVIENHGGAGGMIGTRDAARAAPDGYTIVMLLTGISLGPNPGYDVNKDFAPIGVVASTPIIVDAFPGFPAKSLTDVIALAKKDPGKYSAGTPPAPTINYFAAKLFNLMAKVDITVVTYKGTGPSHQRSSRRPCAARLQHHPGLGEPDRRRTIARHRRRRRQALGGAARCADVGGIRIARFRSGAVLRARGTRRYAAADH